MANPYYSAYLNDVITLCKTLVIKFDMAADAINKEISIGGGVVSSLPQNWKYYMNLAGEYHLTDIQMQITSLDTLEVIDFTKENLKFHRATAKAYYKGSRYYNTLVKRHPNQRSLISGIVAPVDKEVAIAAENGTVLHYDKKLVESQERSLVFEIERFVKSYASRWLVKGYVVTQEFYPAVHLAIIFANLPMHIINYRLSTRGSNEVHSFHIQQRLASHGRLDKYLPQMNLKQKLFLYRNIKYITNNVGTNETFELLLKNIITERNLPLARYDMYHTTGDIPENILPDVEFRRVNLNSHPGDGGDPNRDLDYISKKQEGEARRNYEVQLNNRESILNRFKHSKSDRLKTKVLESALLDTTNSVVYSMIDILINHWGYLTGNGLFNVYLTASNPYNGEKYQLRGKEGFMLYMYLYYKARGITFEKTPTFTAMSVLKRNVPSAEELYDEFKAYITLDEVKDLIEDVPNVDEFISLYPFQKFVETVYKFKNHQVDRIAQTEDIDQRAIRDLIVTRIYEDIEFDMYGDTNMEDWLSDRDIDVSELNDRDLDVMATSILHTMSEGVLGNETNSLQDVQRSMLDIMRQLSSYSVQYVKTINASNFKIANILSIRGSNPRSKAKGRHFVKIADVGSKSAGLKVRTLAVAEQPPMFINDVALVTPPEHVTADIGMSFSIVEGSKTKRINASIGEMIYNVTEPNKI